MASTNMDTIAGALKRVYANNTARMQNLEHRAIDEIAKSARKLSPGGEGYFGSINDYGNESVGALNEGEQFRTIDAEHYDQFKVLPKFNYAPVEITGVVAKAAEGDDESFVNVVLDALERARERLLKDENRQFYGLGNGLMASPSANAASNVTSFAVDSAQYLRANMVVDIYNGATKTVDSIRISDVDKVAGVVYFATSIGVALVTTDQIVKENIRDSALSDGKEMMGLRGIVDDGTDLTTFQNLSAAANRIWRGRRIDASGANLTSDLLQRLLDDVEVLSGEVADTYIMHKKQRRKYLDIVMPQKRYNDQSLDAGFQKVSFNGTELWLDNDCQDDRVYIIKKSLIEKFELCPLEMGQHDGSDKWLRASNFDKFQSYWRHYCNLGTSKRNAHGVIVGLARPAGVA
jgi:hypothetical protein